MTASRLNIYSHVRCPQCADHCLQDMAPDVAKRARPYLWPPNYGRNVGTVWFLEYDSDLRTAHILYLGNPVVIVGATVRDVTAAQASRLFDRIDMGIDSDRALVEHILGHIKVVLGDTVAVPKPVPTKRVQLVHVTVPQTVWVQAGSPHSGPHV